jgi:hypothetical protein
VRYSWYCAGSRGGAAGGVAKRCGMEALLELEKLRPVHSCATDGERGGLYGDCGVVENGAMASAFIQGC